MLTQNAPSRLVVMVQTLMPQLSLVPRFRQFSRGKSALNGNPWRFQPQQLQSIILALTLMFLGHDTVHAQNAPTVRVSPMSLVFAAEQGGETPASQPLNISTTDGQSLTWALSKTAPWLTLDPITGTKVVPVTASVTTGSLAAQTYHDVITLAIAGTEAAKIPVTFVLTPPKGAGPPAPSQNTNKEDEVFVITNFKEQCVKNRSTENIAAGDFGDYISFGPTVAAKAFNYDLASKQITFNAGLGAGLSMRIYNTVHFKSGTNAKGDPVSPIRYGISDIRKKCRAETYDLAWLKPDNQRVSPLFSISPMVFASKSDRDTEIQVQPALTVGFLGELVNVGAGFNLSGPDKGHVFLILSLGYGFKF